MSDRREDLAFASIHELAPKIKDGSVSPVELTQIALERVAKLDSKLNSFLDVWQDEALASAAKVEAGDRKRLLQGTDAWHSHRSQRPRRR